MIRRMKGGRALGGDCFSRRLGLFSPQNARGWSKTDRIGRIRRRLGHMGVDALDAIEDLECESHASERRTDLKALDLGTDPLEHLPRDGDALLQRVLLALFVRLAHARDD